jgi:hypothetical protein
MGVVKVIVDVLLFVFAYVVLLPLTLINFIIVKNKKSYFKSSAINIDRFANYEFRTLWNKTLRKENGYRFGKFEETISSALGKNQRDNTLSKTGKVLVWILDKIEKDHSLKSIK